MISIQDKNNCTGCGACFNVCPKKAIDMYEDKEGFPYPKVDMKKCVDCKLCEKVCPMLNQLKSDNSDNPPIYAAWSNKQNIRLDSTSGGIFSELAYQIISQDGYVCGAIYNEEWGVEHFLTNDNKKIDDIRSSKYLQSDINDIYQKIKEKLVENKTVLFCGSPCQVAGLYNYLQNKYDNLITIDFICRGMNSPKIFKGYLKYLEGKYKSKVTYVKFKNKIKGWHNFSTKIDFANGKKYIGGRYIDSYMVGYLEYNAFMRPSCYECKFKGLPKLSDITLADFWGIENIDEKLDNDQGTSMVLVNSPKGEELLKQVEDKISYTEIHSKETFRGNVCMTQSPEKTDAREKVFDNIDNMTYLELSKNFFPQPNKIRQIKISIRENRLFRKLKRSIKKVLRYDNKRH